MNCEAQENGSQGYNVNGPGSMMQLSNSSSERDGNGCKVWVGGKVTADHFRIHSPKSEGFGVQSGATMYLSGAGSSGRSGGSWSQALAR